MNRAPRLAVLLLVVLGLALAPFHTHPGDGHCNVCKDARVATTVAHVVAVGAAPTPPEPAAAARPWRAPEPRTFAWPFLRAPPAA